MNPARRFCCQHASFDSRAERLLLAVADHANPRCRHARRHQRILGRVGAPLAQRQVVFVRAALVAVAADHNLDVRMAHQVAGVLRKRRLRIAADRIGVVVEEDVLHVGLELFFRAHRVRRAPPRPAAHSRLRSPMHPPSRPRRAPPGDRWSTRSGSPSSRRRKAHRRCRRSKPTSRRSCARSVAPGRRPKSPSAWPSVARSAPALPAAAELLAGGGSGCFFLHPATAIRATSRTTGTNIR